MFNIKNPRLRTRVAPPYTLTFFLPPPAGRHPCPLHRELTVSAGMAWREKKYAALRAQETGDATRHPRLCFRTAAPRHASNPAFAMPENRLRRWSYRSRPGAKARRKPRLMMRVPGVYLLRLAARQNLA